MSRLLTPDELWRGLTHRQWDKDINIPTLKDIVEKGRDLAGERPASGAAKQSWMLAAMRAIDGQIPRPSDAQAKSIWNGDTSSLKHPKKRAPQPQVPQPLTVPTLTREPPAPSTQGTGPPPPSSVNRQIEDWTIGNALILQNNIGAPENLTLEGAYDDHSDPGIVSIQLCFYSSWKARKLVDQYKNPYGLLQTQHYFPNPAGKSYPIRGRGAVWSNNSCPLDCILAAARLLKIGYTTEDYANRTRQGWINTLTPSQQSFIAALEFDWELSSRQTNIKKRHEILKMQILAYNAATGQDLRFGRLFSVVNMWKACTSLTSQFRFCTTTARMCKTCDRSIPDLQPGRAVYPNEIDIKATKEDAQSKQTMQQLLRRHFGAVPGKTYPHGTSCQDDSIVKWLEVIGDLPFHLVIHTNPNYYNVTAATVDDITFQYCSRPVCKQPNVIEPDPEVRTANYRWIGGIYLSEGHYRLYWTDDGPNPQGNLKIYDGMRAMGAIVGGVPPDHPIDKIVEYWASGTAILFYERVEVRGSKRKADGDDGLWGLEQPGKKPKEGDAGPVRPKTPQNQTGRRPQRPGHTTNLGGPTPPVTPQNTTIRTSKAPEPGVDVVDLT